MISMWKASQKVESNLKSVAAVTKGTSIYLAAYQFCANFASTDKPTLSMFFPLKGRDMQLTTISLAISADSVGPSSITSSWICSGKKKKKKAFYLAKSVNKHIVIQEKGEGWANYLLVEGFLESKSKPLWITEIFLEKQEKYAISGLQIDIFWWL